MDRDRRGPPPGPGPRGPYNSRGGPPPRGPPRPIKVDREKTSPFLLRTFVRTGSGHRDEEFAVDRVPHNDEHQLYAWKDTTFRELLLLLRDSSPILRSHHHARYNVRLVYFDSSTSRYTFKDLFTIPVRDLVSSQSRPGPSERTLDEISFVVGDYIDVAYLLPGPSGPGDFRGPGGMQMGIPFANGGGGFRGDRLGGGGAGPVPQPELANKSAAQAWGVPLGGEP
ncbi:hypothetical protein MNV49_006213 [Pseudohyphozyma bogoriensis]|nr:hypothetical protein MNV49_006213 [Pseudohyphozyma bogoriensis]